MLVINACRNCHFYTPIFHFHFVAVLRYLMGPRMEQPATGFIQTFYKTFCETLNAEQKQLNVREL